MKFHLFLAAKAVAVVVMAAAAVAAVMAAAAVAAGTQAAAGAEALVAELAGPAADFLVPVLVVPWVEPLAVLWEAR
ncbi:MULTISPECIES: hypothetical protein [Phyllobacterium]|uniref:hypothetical protein n=1 Tax=Phyllobacterium TaxID=28100 RepID=UPI001CBF120A|nr:hypothetical protein [Phyllobacterium calauticae]MBZ3695450.1 hypothetical protein [Phyllobacterium calauticae]